MVVFLEPSTHTSQSSKANALVMTLFPSPTSTWHSAPYASISLVRPELSAKGKVIVVTGGGTGIGAETARSFAEAGAPRIALGRREQPLLSSKADIERKFPSVKVFITSTDITTKDEVNMAFENFLGDENVDAVVSNAESLERSTLFLDRPAFLPLLDKTIII
jgi:short-subunit dehydrogenase involved in D-alanine esterification of teichoic acids